MFINGRKEIKVREVTLSSINTRNVSPKVKKSYGNYSFNPYELYVSTARSILSSNLGIDTLLEAFSCFYKFQSIIHTNNATLTLNESMVDNLRDFSKTAKLGELAQGITCLISQNILGYPFVNDYHGFLKNKGMQIINKNKSPDYILYKGLNSNQISLIESKCQYRQRNKSSKDKLKKALIQCKSGANYINNNFFKYQVSKYYGLCLNINNEKSIFSSEVDFVDPKIESENLETSSDDLIRYYYASWFLLYCDIENFSRLKIEQPLAKNQKLYSLQKHNDLSYYIYEGPFEPNFNIPQAITLMPKELNRYFFGVKKEVFEYLQEKREFPRKSILGGQNVVIDGSIFFMDGTALIRR